MNINCAVDKSKYKKDRVILHSDCNGFYASVECLHHPEIRNKPVAVSGDAENRHGIILAKNEIAKKYNIKTGEAIWQAKQKCPDLITVPPHFDLYKRFSKMARRIYSEYTEKTNDIVSGTIERIEKGNVFIDIGKIEAMLPEKEQPIGETYEVGQVLKCYVSEVKSGTKGTQIIVSRTHPGLVKKLFEAEVPEIAEGIVEIKNIAREGGSRTKIAVYSNDPNVDAQGACIGPKGIRVQNIGEELKNEKIDIVKWSEDPAEFIAASLSPAKVISAEINEEEKSAHVVVPEYQLSLAIGRAGQNVRLAARLTGWKIDISAED